jgi:hypothetical protein
VVQVAAALYGATHVAEWLLRIGAPLPPLAIEIAAAAGNYPLLQRMLALRRGSLPPLRRAIAAAAKRMRTAAQLLLESAAPKPAEPFIRGGGDGRCLFPGPLIPSAALSADGALAPSPLSAVADAERRVLFAPDPGVRGAPAATIEYAVTGYPLVLSATASIVVPSRITPPLATAAFPEVDGDPTGVTFLTLPVRGFDGPARAVITAFPAGGELYNVLPGGDDAVAGVGGAVRVGAAIPRRQQAVSQLPAAVLNSSGPDGALRPLAPGPWRGRLVHRRVVDCGVCWVNASGAFPECAATAADGMGGDGWYAGCGGDGYEAVMVEYAQVRRGMMGRPQR